MKSSACFGRPITLVVVGLILWLAVGLNTDIANIDLIGQILVGAGVAWFLIELVRGISGNKVATSERIAVVDDRGHEQVVRRDSESDLA